ncbi:hypothetical protein Rhe02_83700 [Rhizocola hellebori]|uniref:DUF2637 domain-containing protein n=1 Tax=Rhizocola hellebori TaxID=1392758 RepID=A0A8J3VLM5_9ACTN|nr:hypothetical protein [Rhizocola hellebori]GIH10303.1 hypothetical protein Rhe02_83700 [Rhizocola hellebori]
MRTYTPAPETRGRVWAYAGAILGGGISLSSNVAYSYLPPAGASADWAPHPMAVVFAAAWPVLLFVALEILVRVNWRRGFWGIFARAGALTPIIVITGLVSWRHIRGMLLHHGEDQIVAALGPLAVDGLMLISTVALFVINLNVHEAIRLAATAEQMTPVLHTPVTPATTDRETGPDIPESLRSTARFAVTNHQSRYGEPPTPGQLAQVMNIPDVVASQLLADLDPAPVLNGQLTGGSR